MQRLGLKIKRIEMSNLRRHIMMQQAFPYIRDGLRFLIDCQMSEYESNRVYDFTGINGYIELYNTVFDVDGLHFNGVNSYCLTSYTFRNVQIDIATVEIVFNRKRAGYNEAIFVQDYNGISSNKNTILYLRNNSSNVICSQDVIANQFADVVPQGLSTISICGGHVLLNNTIYNLTDFAGGSLGNSTNAKAIFGGRIFKGVFGAPFYGDILCIRLYNRVLTNAEILYNQQIDNKRFNLGL